MSNRQLQGVVGDIQKHGEEDGERTQLLPHQIKITSTNDSNNDDNAPLLHHQQQQQQYQQPLSDEKVPPLDKMKVVGFLGFSVVFNVMNTIIYGTLYPKLLEMVTPNHTQVFANTNTASTLCSALLLPLLGSVVDQLGTMKTSLLVCQYFGIFITYGFLLLFEIPAHSQVLWVELIYIIAMFLLRTCVMNNNAQISCFPAKYRVTLSLLGNLIGFVVNLGGLLILRFVPLDLAASWGLTNELWWVAIFVTFVTITSPLTLFGPKPDVLDSNKPTFLRAVKNSFLKVVNTLKELLFNSKYKGILYFLLSYMFFSVAGSMFTLYISTFFIKVYNLSTPDEVMLNLYYKIAMISGTAFGMALDRFFKISEVKLLLVQTIIYCICGVLEYITVTVGLSIHQAYAWAMLLGANYAWNMGVARGLMSKLMPLGKSGEFMALYSTATYIPITVISSIYSAALKAGLEATVLPLLLAICVLPSFPLLYKTSQYFKLTIPTQK